MADIEKIGLLVLRDDRILLCRKSRDTSKLILPGGRVESGESDLECLRREVREELGGVHLSNVEYLGTYEDRAASDDPTVSRTLRITLYRGALVGEPSPSSEISDLVWFGADSDRNELTPILLNRILPDLVARSVLPWGVK